MYNNTHNAYSRIEARESRRGGISLGKGESVVDGLALGQF